MVKVYAVTKTATEQVFRSGTLRYWQYKDVESVGATVLQACRRIKGFWKIKGYTERHGEEWRVQRYKFISHPCLELIKEREL